MGETMNNKIEMEPIGLIHTPYFEHRDIPIQGRFKPEVEAWLEVEKKYESGLMDLEGFSYAILLYIFHGSDKVMMTGRPFLEDTSHGIFSIRSPHRPNHIGLSVVRVICVDGCCLHFSNVDMLDKTPLLDIKPYVSHFDSFSDASNGWIDKHFENGKTPGRATRKNTKDFE